MMPAGHAETGGRGKQETGNEGADKAKFQATRRRGEQASARPIDKHGAYEGTDVGFTSDSIEDSHPKHKLRPRAKK